MSTELTTWADSVTRAREGVAMLAAGERKKVEGALLIAAASFEQVPAREVGRGGHDDKLPRFAAEAGIAYSTLRDLRSIGGWFGNCRQIATISSLSLLKRAKAVKSPDGSRRFGDGTALVEFLSTTESPHPRGEWTADAFREAIGQSVSEKTRRARRPLPQDFHEVDSWADYLVKRRDLAEHALMRLDEKLYPAEKPTAPVPTTRKVDVARRCEGLLRKALSTTPEEAHAALMKVRDLLATYDLVADFKIGER